MLPSGAPTHRGLPPPARAHAPGGEVADRAGHCEADDDGPEPPGQDAAQQDPGDLRQLQGQNAQIGQDGHGAVHHVSMASAAHRPLTLSRVKVGRIEVR